MEAYNGGVQYEPLKLFIGGLSWDTTKDGLTAYFSKFGAVTDAVIMVDPSSKKPRGFGFVTFQDPSSVAQVLSTPEHVIDSKKVDPKRAQIKSPVQSGMGSQTKNTKIFVGGVSAGTSEDDIRGYFSQYGAVTEVDLKMDKGTNRPRGFGFVAFESQEVVEKIVSIHFHQIDGKTVECKFAEPRTGGSQQQGSIGAGAGSYQAGGGYNYGAGSLMQQNYQSYGAAAAAAAAYYQNQPQQQQPPYNYGTAGSYYYPQAQGQYGAGQQGGSSVQGQQMPSYGQETAGYSTRPAYNQPDSYAAQGGYGYDSSQAAAQNPTAYPHYGDNRTASSSYSSPPQGQQSQQQRHY